MYVCMYVCMIKHTAVITLAVLLASKDLKAIRPFCQPTISVKGLKANTDHTVYWKTSV